MSGVMFISDLHLGHENMVAVGPKWGAHRLGVPLSSIDEHDEILITRIAEACTKRTLLYIGGDVAYRCDVSKLEMLNRIPCKKILIKGNHDVFPLSAYLPYFEEVHGIYKKYGMWITHAPVHPDELRNSKNIHGHVHDASMKTAEGWPDTRYINMCVEATHGHPINLDTLRSNMQKEEDALHG